MMLRAGLWAFVGNGGHQFVNFALVIILARLLTPEAFGIVAAAQVIMSLSQVVVQFGLGATLVKTDVLTRNLERTAMTLMLGLALVMATAILLATPWLAQLMNLPELTEIMPVMLITFILSATTSPGMSLLMRDMRFKLMAGINLGTFALIYAVVAVTLALAGWSYWALILATLASTAAQAFVVWLVRPVWPTLAMRLKDVRALFGFGSGVFLANLTITLAQKIDNLIVSVTFGAAALGFYTRGFAMLEIVNRLFGSTFNAILFSGLSKLRRESVPLCERQRIFLMSQAFAAMLSLPLSLLVILLADELVALLLGNQWESIVPLMKVFALGSFLRLTYKATVPVIKSEGWIYSIVGLNTFYAILVSVFAYSVRTYGLIAISWAVLGALFIHSILIVTLALRLLEINWREYIRTIFPIFFMTAPPGAVAFITHLTFINPCLSA